MPNPNTGQKVVLFRETVVLWFQLPGGMRHGGKKAIHRKRAKVIKTEPIYLSSYSAGNPFYRKRRWPESIDALPPDQTLKRMQSEITYLRQEMEFLKKLINSDGESRRRKWSWEPQAASFKSFKEFYLKRAIFSPSATYVGLREYRDPDTIIGFIQRLRQRGQRDTNASASSNPSCGHEYQKNTQTYEQIWVVLPCPEGQSVPKDGEDPTDQPCCG